MESSLQECFKVPFADIADMRFTNTLLLYRPKNIREQLRAGSYQTTANVAIYPRSLSLLRQCDMILRSFFDIFMKKENLAKKPMPTTIA
jgi:hypothetical protein